jgi:hypothetical protein
MKRTTEVLVNDMKDVLSGFENNDDLFKHMHHDLIDGIDAPVIATICKYAPLMAHEERVVALVAIYIYRQTLLKRLQKARSALITLLFFLLMAGFVIAGLIFF